MKNMYKIAAIVGVFGALTACGAGEVQKKGDQAGHKMHNAASGHDMSTDERVAVHLTAGERQHVLAEMRGLLGSTQGIIKGLAIGDMGLVQTSALTAGTGGRKTTENTIMHKKMPKEWMQLGMMAHKSMDEIAQMAADGKPAKDIQLKLVKTMDACSACHAAYQLPSP